MVLHHKMALWQYTIKVHSKIHGHHYGKYEAIYDKTKSIKCICQKEPLDFSTIHSFNIKGGRFNKLWRNKIIHVCVNINLGVVFRSTGFTILIRTSFVSDLCCTWKSDKSVLVISCRSYVHLIFTEVIKRFNPNRVPGIPRSWLYIQEGGPLTPGVRIKTVVTIASITETATRTKV